MQLEKKIADTIMFKWTLQFQVVLKKFIIRRVSIFEEKFFKHEQLFH